MKIRVLAAALVVALLTAGEAGAQAARQLRDTTELVRLEGRRGPSLMRPGFKVAEFTGWANARSTSTRLPWQHRDVGRTELMITAESLGGDVTGRCVGGQGHRQLLFFTWDREELGVDCTFGGAAPEGARMSIALSRGGGVLARIQQPQRAAELVWGDATYRAETRQVGAMPFGSGGVMGYVVSREGVDIAAVDMTAIQPTFYLPKIGSPDRAAAAVMLLGLWWFPDPGREER